MIWIYIVVDLDQETDPDPEADPDPEVDPNPRWIRIFKSLEPELELESQNGLKSDSGAGSRAGIVTPLLNTLALSLKLNFGRMQNPP